MKKSLMVLALALLAAPARSQTILFLKPDQARSCKEIYWFAQSIIVNHEVVTRKADLELYTRQLAEERCKTFLKEEMEAKPADLGSLIPEVSCQKVIELVQVTLDNSVVTQRRQAILDASYAYLFQRPSDPCATTLELNFPGENGPNFKDRLQFNGDADLELIVAYYEGKFFDHVFKKAVPPYGVSNVGVSGNFAAVDALNGKAQAGIAGRASIFGNGKMFTTDPTRVGNENIMARFSFDGDVAINKDGNDDSYSGAVQTRVAFGVFEDNGIYYAPFVNNNFDGKYDNGYTKNASITSFGGELGKKFAGDKKVMYIGVYSGLGALAARNGKKIQTDEAGNFVYDEEGASKIVPNKFYRTVPMFGVSMLGQFGVPNKKGAVYVDGTVEYLTGAGVRSNLSVDTNVSKHIKVGVGVRQVSLKDPEKKRLNLLVPALRVTAGIDSKSGYKSKKK